MIIQEQSWSFEILVLVMDLALGLQDMEDTAQDMEVEAQVMDQEDMVQDQVLENI